MVNNKLFQLINIPDNPTNTTKKKIKINWEDTSKVNNRFANQIKFNLILKNILILIVEFDCGV